MIEILQVGTILGTVMAGLAIISRWDAPILLDKRQWGVILLAALLESAGIRMLFCGEVSRRGALLGGGVPRVSPPFECPFLWEQIFWGIFAGCLLLACVTDLKQCQVYNFVWWLALVAAFGLFLSRLTYKSATGEVCIIISNLAIFCGLQLFFFRRMYGKADCYAFMVCGVVETALGMELAGYLWHMLLAYVLLALVQGLKRNISERGNLKRPVPFLPYITISFWGIIIYFC